MKYRGTYRIYMPIDLDTGNTTSNMDDTYIQSRSKKAIVYRYSKDTLVLEFNSNGYANNRLEELYAAGVDLKLFQRGDYESTYFFPESQLPNVAEIIDVTTWGKNKSPIINHKRKGKKRYYTEEEKEALVQRLQEGKAKKKKQQQSKSE